MLIKRENSFDFPPSDFFLDSECRVCSGQGAQMFYGGLVCPLIFYLEKMTVIYFLEVVEYFLLEQLIEDDRIIV